MQSQPLGHQCPLGEGEGFIGLQEALLLAIVDRPCRVDSVIEHALHDVLGSRHREMPVSRVPLHHASRFVAETPGNPAVAAAPSAGLAHKNLVMMTNSSGRRSSISLILRPRRRTEQAL